MPTIEEPLKIKPKENATNKKPEDKKDLLVSGDLIEVKIKTPEFYQKDEKTGAVIVEIY